MIVLLYRDNTPQKDAVLATPKAIVSITTVKPKSKAKWWNGFIELYKQKYRGQKMGLEILSPREKQVLELMKKGLMVKQIAFDLDLDHRTISTYKRRIYEKLNVKSEWELALYVSRFVDIIQKDSKYNNNGTQEIVLGPFM